VQFEQQLPSWNRARYERHPGIQDRDVREEVLNRADSETWAESHNRKPRGIPLTTLVGVVARSLELVWTCLGGTN